MQKVVLLLMSLLLVTSCLKDDDYTTSANDKLTFSRDTVAVDTIISGTPSKTYSLTIYNQADKAIRIPQIMLGKGGSSPFYVNADGTQLVNGVANDFEIARKDSMIVYVMANIPSSDADDAVAVEDKLCFQTESGLMQEVVLTAQGLNVITLSGMRISQNTTLDATKPYRVMDSLVVERGAELTLAPGTRFLFHNKAALIVHGTLHIDGSREKPVTLRGDRLDLMFKNQPYDRTPGLWDGIVLKSQSYGNTINYADIHSSTNGLCADSSDISRSKLKMENSIIHNTTNHALNLRMANVFVGNSQITNAGGDCVHVRGGDVSLVHCTIGRFYVFTGGYGHALDFANFDGDVRLPLHNLYVANSIVTGYQDDEIIGGQNTDFENDAFNYNFAYSLLDTPQPEKPDDRIESCLWDTRSTDQAEADSIVHDKNFTPAFNVDHLLFYFTLSPYSPAVGQASPSISQQYYPYDRTGAPRTAHPDMGCYNHAETTETPKLTTTAAPHVSSTHCTQSLKPTRKE